MTGYASLNDLESGWRPLVGNERNVASVLLSRASELLDARIRLAGLEPVSIAMTKAELCKIIVCDMVRYSMTSSNAYGGDVFAETGQSYMQGEMVGGSLLVTDAHMKMLGIGKTRAGFIGHGD